MTRRLDPSTSATRQVEVGDPVVAIGNPFALDRTVPVDRLGSQRQIQALTASRSAT
jgi:S1-C subfamily serine protease